MLDASVTACSSSMRAEGGGQAGDPVSRARERERERESTDAACHCIPHHSLTHPHCAFPSVPRLLSHSTCIYISLSLSLSLSSIALPPSRVYVHAATLVYLYMCVCVYVCKSRDGSRE